MPTKKKEYVKFGTTKIRIPKNEGAFYTLIKIIYANSITQEGGGSIEDYFVALFESKLVSNNNKKNFSLEKENNRRFTEHKYVNKQIEKYTEFGSYLIYMNSDKTKLIINFPMYGDPYIGTLAKYHNNIRMNE